jgi:hypothetical protein
MMLTKLLALVSMTTAIQFLPQISFVQISDVDQILAQS